MRTWPAAVMVTVELTDMVRRTCERLAADAWVVTDAEAVRRAWLRPVVVAEAVAWADVIARRSARARPVAETLAWAEAGRVTDARPDDSACTTAEARAAWIVFVTPVATTDTMLVADMRASFSAEALATALTRADAEARSAGRNAPWEVVVVLAAPERV